MATAAQDLASRRIVVMGLGRFGGGAGVARFLVEQGADVLVTDIAKEQALARALSELSGLPIRYRLGEHDIDDFTAADLIVVNPAVDPRGNRFLEAAANAGVPTATEIRLLVERLPSRRHVVGVTGSAGKSTVTAMIGHVLRSRLGDAAIHVGGNLGGSLLPHLAAIRHEHRVVLELSSFMLEDLDRIRWSPSIAVATNIHANHLDRHGTMAAYVHAKQAILRHQQPDDIAVLGPDVADWPTRGRRRSMPARTPDLPLRLPGEHNRHNAALALAAAGAVLGTDPPHAALVDFRGLPHRLQLVCEHGAVRYYDDSKSTTPAAALMALRSFADRIVHVILGGYDKQSDLTELARFARRHCRAVYTVGATGPTIERACRDAPGPADVVGAGTVPAAVAAIVGRVRPRDVVLLSPACASWDQFQNFEARGDAFAAAVLRHTGEGAPPPTA